MTQDQTLPDLWLLSDARNDAVIEDALARLPSKSGFIFRHYHLDPGERRKRFQTLQSAAQKRNHLVILADTPVKAKQWQADGIYGGPERMPKGDEFLKLVTAHNWKEIVAADRAGADAIFLSPVFATRSHPNGKALGSIRFRTLANKAKAPVIALGGMTKERSRQLSWQRWAAIDGLS